MNREGVIACILDWLFPSTTVSYDDYLAKVEWLALVGQATEEMLARHRLSGTVCECTRHFHTKHGWRIHLGLMVAEEVGKDERAAGALTAYQRGNPQAPMTELST